MSVNLMSAIFETEFFDLKDESGNVTKASTAKLVLLAMADHANDEGEGAYPSVSRLARKTALSEQTIRNTFDTLRYNGIISLEGVSKHGTNNHTINTNSFPKAIGKEVTVLTLYPLDPLTGTETPLTGKNPTQPVIPESITINKPYSTAYNRGEQEPPDKVMAYLQMMDFPGAKREAKIDAILSFLGVTFKRNTSTKEWKEFAKYILSEKTDKGWDVEVFCKWLLSKPDYKPDFWSVKRMMEFYPQAFIEVPSEEKTRLL